MANYVDVDRVERILQPQGDQGLSVTQIRERIGAATGVINKALAKRPDRFERVGDKPAKWRIRGAK